jgi:hypothetical protein
LVLDRRTRCLFPFIERIFADAGYQGPRAARAAARTGRWVFEIVKRNAAQIRRIAQALDRRTNPGLDQPQSPLGTRFRALRPHRRCLRQTGHDPHHAPTPDPGNSFNLNRNFPDRL